ncbi:MAG: response regulator [Clostridiales bacterium]|nr:response regulator [Clostridiales bacterium]
MLRLMIVDDEQIIREALSEMIDYASIGYELIATARNGMEAYDIICDKYPDVVITDIRMPILNGLDLIERSMKTDSKITFILLSGYSEFEYAKQAMKYGVRYYLLKPTDKQELIDSLVSIRRELEMKEVRRKEEQERLLCDLQTPLEQSFIMETLERPEEFAAVYAKYQSLLSIPHSGLSACVCSFVEEPYVKNFIADARRILQSSDTLLKFPVVYVRNSVLLIVSAPTLACQEDIRQAFGDLMYDGQSVSFETSFLHEPSSEELFHSIVLKIARYERILLIDSACDIHEIRNNITSPWHISQLGESLANARGETEVCRLLDTVFTASMPLETARNLALSLFLKLNSDEDGQSLDIACDFFRRLYTCPAIYEIKSLMEVVLLQKNMDSAASKTSGNIALLKSYVEQHLDSENLSLKWLAENYLFVSVGYLSKQFVREEGMRFSDYLNKKRMEEAVRLMIYYHSDNIKNIARSVGFGANPQYFSQVFKRYTGSTPTDYIEKIKQENQ